MPAVMYILGLSVAVYGWGLLVNRLARYPRRHTIINLPVGMAVLIFFGGILNLFRLAYGWAFDSLVFFGIVLLPISAGNTTFRLSRPQNKNEWAGLILVVLSISAIMMFVIQTQFPPRNFNYHDDFEKYFAHPVRMLQTGTLFGSPLSAIGSETLGGQAVLHGIFLNHFPIAYINGVDAVFGLFLCLLLSVSAGLRCGRILPLNLIGVWAVFFINPQYVNVSACYTAAALMMTAVLVATPAMPETDRANHLASPLIIGLIYAALVCLKSNFVLFPILHMCFYVAAQIVLGTQSACLSRWVVLTVGATFLSVLPWILLHLPNYLHASFSPNHTAGLPGVNWYKFFSREALFYANGNSFAHYTLLAVSAVFCAGIYVLLRRKGNRNTQNGDLPGVVSSAATVFFAYVLTVLSGPLLNSYQTNLRYTVPYLIAVVPILFSLTGHLAITKKNFINRAALGVVLLFGAVVLTIFSASLFDRISRGYRYGTVLAIPSLVKDRAFMAYNEYVLDGGAQSRIQYLQNRVPAGRKIVAWVTAPFYFDYKRNVIYDAEPAGIASPWARMPDAEYFIAEYKGPAVRLPEQIVDRMKRHPGRHERYIAQKSISFLNVVHHLKKDANILFDDGSIMVFKKNDK